MRQDAVNATVKGVIGGMRGANSILWGNRVIQNATTTYGFPAILASMEMIGGNMQTAAGDSTMILTVGADSYGFTLAAAGVQTYATPPSTYVNIHLATVKGVAVAADSPYTMW